MAASSCGKCDGRMFQIMEKIPSGSAFKLMFVQCSSCGTPVGVLDYMNIGAVAKSLEARLKNLETALMTITHSLNVIDENVRRSR